MHDLKIYFALVFQGNPLSIEELSPRFGWVLHSELKGDKQTAYEIEIASTIELLTAGKADCWKSGKIESDRSQGNLCHTPGLKKEFVELWNNVTPLAKQSVLLRKKITVDKSLENARIYIAGLGQYDLFINGKQVDEWFQLEVNVPVNTTATLTLPGQKNQPVQLESGMHRFNVKR